MTSSPPPDRNTAEPAPGSSAAVARRLAPTLVRNGTEQPITADQTNRSVVVDEAVIVKWFRPPLPHPHHGVEMLTHLDAAGFREMPDFYGADVVDGLVEATASEFVTGATDGWDWFVTELVGVPEGDVQPADVLESAHAIGELAARLHGALATRGTTSVHGSAESRHWTDLLATARAVTRPEVAAVLSPRLDAISDALDQPLPDRNLAVTVHGDLHVGQLLRAGDRLAVTDFDGNPLLEAADRSRPRPAAVDVASLVQSVDHAGRVAQRRLPHAATELEAIIGAATDATLAAYRAELIAAGWGGLLDERMLWPLRVAQELHELVYADRHLPRWCYAPAATLRTMFP